MNKIVDFLFGCMANPCYHIIIASVVLFLFIISRVLLRKQTTVGGVFGDVVISCVVPSAIIILVFCIPVLIIIFIKECLVRISGCKLFSVNDWLDERYKNKNERFWTKIYNEFELIDSCQDKKWVNNEVDNELIIKVQKLVLRYRRDRISYVPQWYIFLIFYRVGYNYSQISLAISCAELSCCAYVVQDPYYYISESTMNHLKQIGSPALN